LHRSLRVIRVGIGMGYWTVWREAVRLTSSLTLKAFFSAVDHEYTSLE
jgi:hypothetical protein